MIILAFGLHSILLGRTGYYTSENIFLSINKNEFGFFVGLFSPFFILFFVKGRRALEKGTWGLFAVWAIFGTLLSASRGAIGSIFTAIVIWFIFLLKKKHLKTAFICVLIFSLFMTFSFSFWPDLIKETLLAFPKNISTFTMRTDWFWKPAAEAVKKRPIFGWGYGDKIYRDQRPFEGVEKPDWEKRGGLHSTFISILFHQGIAGLLSYLFLLFSTTFILTTIVRNETQDRRLLALSFLSIIVGAAIVNSFVLSVPLRRIAPILGMSAALLKHSPKSLNG
jgi:O-antigen ligase